MKVGDILDFYRKIPQDVLSLYVQKTIDHKQGVIVVAVFDTPISLDQASSITQKFDEVLTERGLPNYGSGTFCYGCYFAKAVVSREFYEPSATTLCVNWDMVLDNKLCITEH